MRSASADQSRLAVYAARRASDGATTIVVVNKTGSPLDSTVNLASFQPGSAAAAYQWTGGAISRIADVPIKVKGSKKVSLVLQLSRSFRKKPAREETLKTTLSTTFGKLKAKQSITLLAPKPRRKG